MGQIPAGRSPERASGVGDAWKPSGVITLLSDFGSDDPYVGMMKGVLLSAAPGCTLVDLTHGVPPQSVRIGAWFLAHSFRYFPAGTVHLAVVDPGVGSRRRLLAAQDGGHAFLAPDNGLLGPLLSEKARVFELDAERFALAGGSRTFHGRDILAPAAAAVCRGLAPAETGAAAGPLEPGIEFPRARAVAPGRIECEVLLADRYGNLILSARPADLDGDLERWTVEAAGRTIPLRGAYSESARGELLALVDSYGALEIAVNEGSAAGRLGLRAGDPVTLARHA